MKKFTISLDYYNICQLKDLLKLIEGDKYPYIEWHFVVDMLPSAKEISEIYRILDEFSKQHDIVFKKYIACRLQNYSRTSLKAVKKHRFYLEVLIKDVLFDIELLKRISKTLIKNKQSHKYIADVSADKQMTVYNVFAEVGLPLNFKHINYTDEMISLFPKWLQDKKAIPLNIFDYILRLILLRDNMHNCCYSSCLGKNVYFRQNGDISFCTLFPVETVIGNVNNLTCFNEIYHNEKFIDVLQGATEQRNNCIATCGNYAYCQGGCPLNSNMCTNQNYIKLVELAQKELINVLQSNDLSKYNSCVKSAVYDSLAFNSTFNIKNRKENRDEKI